MDQLSPVFMLEIESLLRESEMRLATSMAKVGVSSQEAAHAFQVFGQALVEVDTFAKVHATWDAMPFRLRVWLMVTGKRKRWEAVVTRLLSTPSDHALIHREFLFPNFEFEVGGTVEATHRMTKQR